MSSIVAQPTKICTKCGKEYPATLDYFHKQSSAKCGLRPNCKSCTRIARQRYYELHCQMERANASIYRHTHPDIVHETNQRWYENNREYRHQYNRLYYQLTSGKQRELARLWHKNNLERAHANNRRFRKEHPETIRAKEQRREARKRALPATLTIGEWEDIKAEFNYCCAYCGKAWFEIKGVLEQEHVIPVARGGGYTADNIVPARRICNARKKDKTPEEAGMPILKPRP